MSLVVLRDRAQEWLASDPNAADRAELAALLADAEAGDATAHRDLTDRMSGLLAFGTAGLRSALGAGPNRMNAAVVTRATAAVCAVLRQELGDGFTVVIGRDARHRSAEFADIAAGVVQAAGGQAFVVPGAAPTPLLAWSMRQLDCDAGIMVTASHNPAADNGYKLYLGGRIETGWGRGVQIIGPWDERIAAAMQATGPANDIPVASGWQPVNAEVLDAYIERTGALADDTPAEAKAALRVVMTSLHGVGAQTARKTLSRAGFAQVFEVVEQRDPDPDFPTVAFPNPEEPGVLNAAIALARQVDADLIVAHDPDADRCAAAIPDASADTGWRQLSGDEVGWLLGAQAAARHAGDSSAVLARSLVSSQLLGRIARASGCGSAVTLTGFKWISRTPGLVFGYEEALGYCIDPDAVRDKDGIAASVCLAELAALAKAAGRSLADLLDDLALQHGLHVTSPLTFRVAELTSIAEAMTRLRATPLTQLAGSPVTSVQDFVSGGISEGCVLPPTNALEFVTDAHDRVLVRPSGTEPKLKCYLEVVLDVSDRSVLAQARAQAQLRLNALKRDLSTTLDLTH